MLLGTMSYKEFFDELMEDAPKVKYKLDSLIPKAQKSLSKEKSYTAWRLYDYTIPSTNNTHYFFYYLNGDIITTTTFFVLFHNNHRFVIQGMKMGYKHTPESEPILLPIISIYTSHFFKRYNERFLHNNQLTANEIAGIYFTRNEMPLPVNLNEDINRNFKKHGEQNFQGVRVKDGFCFTDSSIDGDFDPDGNRSKDNIDAMRIIYTTFVNEYDMTETQRAAINKECKEVLDRCKKDFLINR